MTMNRIANGVVLLALALACGRAWAEKPDWQSMDAPSDPAAIVTVPEFPEVNRAFAIQRSRGTGTVMRVADAKGRLEILDGDKVVTSFRLGRCLSFSRMNAQHDFGAQGSPQYATAPADCRVWNSRRWTQTYKTQTTYYRNPCVYEPEFVATVEARNGTRLVHTLGTGRGQILDNGKTFSINTNVTFDESLGFFRMFDVGYIGRIDVLNEIK
jgi:hypothetical protein